MTIHVAITHISPSRETRNSFPLHGHSSSPPPRPSISYLSKPSAGQGQIIWAPSSSVGPTLAAQHESGSQIQHGRIIMKYGTCWGRRERFIRTLIGGPRGWISRG